MGGALPLWLDSLASPLSPSMQGLALRLRQGQAWFPACLNDWGCKLLFFLTCGWRRMESWQAVLRRRLTGRCPYKGEAPPTRCSQAYPTALHMYRMLARSLGERFWRSPQRRRAKAFLGAGFHTAQIAERRKPCRLLTRCSRRGPFARSQPATLCDATFRGCNHTRHFLYLWGSACTVGPASPRRRCRRSWS